VIRANPADIRLLREQLQREGPPVEFVEDHSVRHGIVVTTANGNIVCDQSITRRRQRQDHELRLVAAEILFSDEPTPSKIGESK
jgi:vacuolar-type H+-ATPase subunit E/Vma4